MQAWASDGARWVHSEVLRRALLDVAEILAPHGVELVAVKGIYLVHVLGVDPIERPMFDADAIVVRGSFAAACEVLIASGDWVATEGWSSKGLSRRAGLGGNVDLHRMALPPCFGDIRLSSLLKRARPHPSFGRVLAPDALDAACLTVAHYVKDCLPDREYGGAARDLDWLVERAGVTPKLLACRLREHRLRRVGMVAFSALADGDRRWLEWLEALEPSWVDRTTSRGVVRAVRRQVGAHPDLAFLAIRSLGDSIGRSACGFSATAARLLRDRAKRVWTS